MDTLLVTYAPAAWMIAGALCMLAEALLIPGVGFLFAGLGAITTGIALMAGLPGMSEPVLQFAWFFAFTTIWAILLWKPLKKLRLGKTPPYRNIIGDTAIVIGKPLTYGQTGEVRWSGTVMNARIADDAPETLDIQVGSEVKIIDVTGNMLLVKAI
jgi:membrane protein implicated in regulation of membrane protease activity